MSMDASVINNQYVLIGSFVSLFLVIVISIFSLRGVALGCNKPKIPIKDIKNFGVGPDKTRIKANNYGLPRGYKLLYNEEIRVYAVQYPGEKCCSYPLPNIDAALNAFWIGYEHMDKMNWKEA